MTRPEVKLIAFYLPQYHPIPENDRWWGEGFTEWHNVAGTEPRFDGHQQPRLPADLGFYDLRLPEVRERQAALARRHGIFGFCYYVYWFSGKRLLQRPLEAMLASGQPDMPFCICWANENWTRRWDGLESEILIAQEHTEASDSRFIEDVLQILADPRYIRVDGRPLILVYRADLLVDPVATTARWRATCVRAGLGDPYLAAVEFRISDPRPLGFDALVEFPPHAFAKHEVTQQMPGLRQGFRGVIYDYGAGVAEIAPRNGVGYPIVRGVMPAWDNTPRRGPYAHIYYGSSPNLYRYWLSRVIEETAARPAGDPGLVFINAWNEWAEGAILEPCQRYGRAYLEATWHALMGDRPLPEAQDAPGIAAGQSEVAPLAPEPQTPEPPPSKLEPPAKITDPAAPGLIEWRLHHRETAKREQAAGEKGTPAGHAPRPIVFVSHDAARAGAQRTLLDIMEPFARQPDLEVFVVLCEGGELTEELAQAGHLLDLSRLVARGLSRAQAIQALVAEIVPREPLLVACNTVVTADVAAAFAAAGVPVWSLIWELATSIDSAFGEASFTSALASARRVTVASEHCRRALVQRFDADPDRLTPLLIGMPCDPATLEQRRTAARGRVLPELGLEDEAFLVIGCGSIHHRKGTDLFVQAAIEALRGPGSERMAFVWIGGDQIGPTFRHWCEHDIAAAGLGSRVRLAGPRAKPMDYFAAADAFILSSREDPFPRVVLEAMAHGLPVIAFADAGGAPEALADGAGVVVPYLDVSAMAREVARLAGAPRYRAGIRDKALARITTELSPATLHHEVQRILRDDFGYQGSIEASGTASATASGATCPGETSSTGSSSSGSSSSGSSSSGSSSR